MKWFEIPHQGRALAAGIQEPEDIYFPHFVLCAEKSDIWGGSAIFPLRKAGGNAALDLIYREEAPA